MKMIRISPCGEEAGSHHLEIHKLSDKEIAYVILAIKQLEAAGMLK
jgi:hypothetical protein